MFSLLQNGYRSYLGDSNHFRLWKKIKNFVGCFCFCQCIALLAFKSCVGSSRGRRSQLLSILLLLAFIFTEWIIYELAVDMLCETSLCNHGSLLREFFFYMILSILQKESKMSNFPIDSVGSLYKCSIWFWLSHMLLIVLLSNVSVCCMPY